MLKNLAMSCYAKDQSLGEWSTKRQEIVKFLTERIPMQNVSQSVAPNDQHQSLDDSFDEDLGPHFGSMNQQLLPNANDFAGRNTAHERTLAAIGYVPSSLIDFVRAKKYE